jgi:hypothetical protein
MKFFYLFGAVFPKLLLTLACLYGVKNTFVFLTHVKHSHAQPRAQKVLMLHAKVSRPALPTNPSSTVYTSSAKPTLDQIKTSDIEKLRRMEDVLNQKFSGVLSCRRAREEVNPLSSLCYQNLANKTFAENNSHRILYYNPFHKPRRLCGRTFIEAKGALLLDDVQTTCGESLTPNTLFGATIDTHLFPVIPSQENSKALPPI